MARVARLLQVVWLLSWFQVIGMSVSVSLKRALTVHLFDGIARMSVFTAIRELPVGKVTIVDQVAIFGGLCDGGLGF